MNRQEQMNMLKKEYEQIEVPAQAFTVLQAGIDKAKREGHSGVMPKRSYWGAWAAAAAVLVFIAVPNVSPAAAMAMADMPVLNKVVQVVTFNRYTQMTEDKLYAANVQTAKLEVQGDAQLQSSVGEINAEVKAYAEQMIAQFQQEMEAQGGVYGLDIGYTVVTDSDKWFTLEIITTETMASGAETVRYYNLDKETGKYVHLADLFPKGYDYVTAISEDIKAQMMQRMAEDENQSYFINSDMPEEDFQQIAPDQQFYVNQDGQLVIVFNEYEVAPGSMGCPQFILDSRTR